ncbi:uncharacterized protein B0H64DRAFT_432052 [Chaetomium fimeti]|uniref:F-box domain-containing protein n=1 Tax=Chaetomium fimeti TaxID=1854472 RepID=A0AAE0HEW0_9PEZI|nr:hypothetical protein B0H64DRAFT_432052 [Chaetomium fimeti]
MADPPSLLTMPVEIQLEICDHLLQSTTRTKQPKPGIGTWQSTMENYCALGSLSLTCKHFRKITAPLLYRRVRVSIRKPAAFIRLIRRFSQFPGCAKLVSELTIHSGRAGSALSRSQKNFLFREAHRLGLRLLIGGNGLSSQLESILIDVALCRLSTIRKLTLSLPGTTTTEEGQFPPPLNESDVESHEPFAFRYANRFPAFFALSSLQRLEAYPMTFNETATDKLHSESLAALLSRTPALTHLKIGRCDQGTSGHGIIQNLLPQLRDIHLVDALDKDLAAIKTFCPQLERFRLGEDGRGCSPMQSIFMMLGITNSTSTLASGQPRPSITPSVFKALLPMKGTLHDFDLDCDTFRAQTIRDLTHLAHFRALRSLRLVFGTWPTGDNAALIRKLSPDLESLCLGGGEIPVYDIAVLLSERIREGRLSKLKRFEYTLLRNPAEELITGAPPSLNHEMSQKVAAVLKEYGVYCVQRPYPPPMDTA